MGSPNYIPLNPDGSSQGAQPSLVFMARSLLSSRLEIGLSTDDEHEEQDVNIYLTHLLCAYIEPAYLLRIGQYLVPHNTTLFERIQYSQSNRLKYTVYRVNADHLLMSIGIFGQLGAQGKAIPLCLPVETSAQIGRGQSYYDYAATFGHCIFGRANAVPEVLGKLAAGFAKYVRILAHLRGEYLNLVERMSPGELYHLQQEVQAKGLEELHNEFLDALQAYKNEPTPEHRVQLLAVVQHIQRFDPDFQFT